MFKFNNHHQGPYCCALLKLQSVRSCGCSHTTELIHNDVFLTNLFNNCNFSKAQQ